VFFTIVIPCAVNDALSSFITPVQRDECHQGLFLLAYIRRGAPKRLQGSVEAPHAPPPQNRSLGTRPKWHPGLPSSCWSSWASVLISLRVLRRPWKGRPIRASSSTSRRRWGRRRRGVLAPGFSGCSVPPKVRGIVPSLGGIAHRCPAGV